MDPSSTSSLSCCCASNSVDLSEILRRITPIDYYPGFINDNEPCPTYKGTLLVDSNQYIYGKLAFPICGSDPIRFGTVIDDTGISTGNVYVANSIYVGQTQITSNGPILELPCGTTVCGVPISTGSSVQYFILPVTPTNGQLSNLPNTSLLTDETYIVGGFFQNGYIEYVKYVYYWPCLFSTDPTDPTITIRIVSLYLYLNAADGLLAAGVPLDAHDIVATIYIRDQFGGITAIPQSTVTWATLENFTSYYFGKENINVDVKGGDRAGVRISWEGQLSADETQNFTWITYNIGYVIIPT